MKRFILFGLSVFLACSVLMCVAPSASAASWADSYLQNLVRREVMRGDISGNLDPDRYVTRAEFAAMMNRAFGFTVRGNKTFKDVPSTAWFAADLDIASTQGYLQGDGKGVNPNGNLTREEAVTLLCRALKIAPHEGEGFHLTDERNFSNWSRGYINAAVGKTFVSGYPDGSFRPANRITRGEAAKLLSEVAGEIVTSRSSNLSGVVNGNATINSSGLTLSNVTVLGDLYLTEGVGLGYVNLKNVTVSGELVISGAGESNVGKSSITLTDCNISNLVVDVAKQKILTLKTDKSSVVENTLIKSSTYLEELSNNFEGFKNVNLNGPSGTFLNLTGSFGEVRMISPASVLNLYKGKVTSLTVDEKAKGAKIFLEKDTYTTAMYFDTGATVTGKGQIESVLINNDGVVIEQLPQNIYIRPGVTAKIDGKTMGSLDAEMDALSPDFSYGYPKADKIQPAGFTQYYMTNKPGKVYYAVYPAGTNMPSKDELMAKNASPKNAIKSGNLSTLPAKEVSVAISGLKAGQQYVVYSFFLDFRGASSDIKRTNVETVDNVMPTLLSGYPKLVDTKNTSATIGLLPNKDTSYYWAVLPANAVAPTSDQLYAQNISGALAKKVTFGGKMNTQSEIDTGATLQENVSYVFYVVLRDGADNMSKTPYKLAFTTRDMKAPEFKPNDGTYPKVGAVTASSIPIDYVVNEPCTVYWSAVKMGTNLLPLKSDQKPDLENQKSKDLIKNGTGAFKAGKSTASKEGQLYNISVSGLEQQMPYDIYFMLEDKSGNQSTITMLTAKTKDTIPPTVSLDSPQIVGGNFSVDSPVIINFSEIVCGADFDPAGEPVRLSKLFADDNSASKKVLDNYIRLMDTSQNPETRVTIDWTKATVKDVDAKTVITFQPEALKLINNNAYRFDFAYLASYGIRDTSKNELKTRTTATFKTVPPLTFFSEVKSINSKDYDSAFFVRPESQQTGDYIFFDIMIRADYPIEFKLFQGTDINAMTQVGTGSYTLQADYATPLSRFLGSNAVYKTVKPTYYALKLTKIGSTVIDPNAGSPMSASVNLKMNAVIGNLSKLQGLPSYSSDFESKLKAAIATGDVSSVTAPNDPFQIKITLVDTVPPELVSATFKEGDTQSLMYAKTTKGCTLFYYVIPEELKDKTPTTYQIQNARSDSGRGIAAGSFQIPEDSTVATEYTIKGLLPPKSPDTSKKYIIYFYLQGKAPDPSKVYTGEFNTIPVSAPKLIGDLQYVAGGGMVTVSGSWDADSTMYYVVYPANVYDESVKKPTADEIINPVYSSQVVAQGSMPVKQGTRFDLKVLNLDYTRRYDFFAVTQKYVGTEPAGPSSEVVSSLNMAPLDNIRPTVSDGSPYTTIVHYDPGSKSFTGYVEVNFSEGLYYFEQNSAIANPLTPEKLKTSDMLLFMPSDANVKLTATTKTGIEDCVNYVQFSFTGLQNGATISFGKTIGDKALNIAGDFKMTFQAGVNEAGEPVGTWTAGFSGGK